MSPHLTNHPPTPANTRLAARALTTLALAAIAPLMASCGFQQHREQLAQLYANGDFARATAELNDPEVLSLYGSQDQLLLDLDRGALAFYSGDDARAFTYLERAESFMDLTATQQSTGDAAASWLLNDTFATYAGEPYEDVYVNVLKLMGHLRQGNIEGAATVEARRVAAKTTRLRDRFAATSAATRNEAKRTNDPIAQRALEAAESPDLVIARSASPAPGTSGPNTRGQFIDSPLGTYLTAVTFMKAGEPDSQSVAARRLTTAIIQQGTLIGDVDAGQFSALETLRPSDASVLLIALSGRGPIKFAQRFGPIPLFDFPVYFELPQLQTFTPQARSVRATLTPTTNSNSTTTSESAAPLQVTLNLVEDLSRVATENHRRQLPLIYARTLIRATLKSAATAVAAEAVRRGQGGSRGRSNGEAVLVVLGGLAAMIATERADVRCWTFLPGQAHVALVNAPPGRYAVRYDFLDASGRVLYTQEVAPIAATSNPQDLATTIGHWWR